MEVVKFADIGANHKDLAIALGNFDGVHLGHQELLKGTIKAAHDLGIKSAVMLFDPHPSQFFGKENFKLISPLSLKIKKLESLGVDYVIIMTFDASFMKMTAEEFVENILISALKAKFISTGYNFHFGNKRLGNSSLLEKYSVDGKFVYRKLEQVSLQKNCVSSTLIREIVSVGRVQKAADYLGSNFVIEGEVVEGKKLARTIGFPTANIKLEEANIAPLFGVYFVRATISGRSHNAIANIGIRPSFDDKAPTLEVNIFDFSDDIYGKNISVEFLSLIRPERTFESIEQLKWHIAQDVKSAKYIIRNLT